MKRDNTASFPQTPNGKNGWPWTIDKKVKILNQTQKWPKVTIITPVYNGVQFIEESIRSVLMQDYPNLEYIIMDGGSTDGSVEIIRKYEPWLTYWESRKDRGQSHAINKGLARATGEFFNWQNADDILLPGTIFENVSIFEKNPHAVYVNRSQYQEDMITRERKIKRFSKTSRMVLLEDALPAIRPGYHPGGLMRRDVAIAAGGLDETFQVAMDLDLQLRMLLEGPGFYEDSPAIVFRWHPGQKTQSQHQRFIHELFLIVDKMYARLPKGHPLHAMKLASLGSARYAGARLCRKNGLHGKAAFYDVIQWMALTMNGIIKRVKRLQHKDKSVS
ncbi:MAG: glycosyltransferase family 2 protein [Promethearchaeota archaeon]